jgi:glycosyltransferase involved in cell wall biosynthesis
MRIAFLSWRDTAHPRAGGSEVVVDQLAQRLASRGHDVALIHGGPSDPHRYASRSAGGTYSQYVLVPVAHHREPQPDVVVDVENGIPFFAPLWQRRPVVALVHHVHTDQWAMQFPRLVAAVGRWLESRAMPAVYRRTPFVAVSSSTAEALRRIGVAEERITTIEMGIDLRPARRQPSPTPRFVVLGRLVPHKRVELALACWDRVRPVTGGELVVVGDGPEHDRLRALAGPGIRFTGSVDEQRKREELAAAWALVHPAHHEGWGTVIMEAAASGVPTVAFDVPGVRDSVVHGETGLLARDPDDLVEHWTYLATDPRRRAELGEAARARAARYGWDRAVDAFEAVLVAARRGADGVGADR